MTYQIRMSCFPKEEDFPRREITRWRDLPTEVLEVRAIEDRVTKYGPAKKAILASRGEVMYESFMPKSVERAVAEKKPPFFILNNGLVPWRNDPSKNYYDVSVF